MIALKGYESRDLLSHYYIHAPNQYYIDDIGQRSPLNKTVVFVKGVYLKRCNTLWSDTKQK
ncbi:hypothetical protein DC914_RS23315 [Vibrio parahaemolyticus]|nr:hypothetical protein [Vibrio parahaemolyticus]